VAHFELEVLIMIGVLLRWLIRSVLLTVAVRILGRLFPSLRRLLRIFRR
jgi:hypothetical protein